MEFGPKDASSRVSFVRSPVSGNTTIALLLGIVPAVGALGAPQSLVARQDPSVESGFSVNFGIFGGVSQAQVTNTGFAVDIDVEKEHARFLYYEQDVAPLSLPGGANTGAIHVSIIASAGGTFDEQTGEFATQDTYAIYFEGDLSAFGLESPFILPSESTGIITFENDSAGRAVLNWRGEGFIPLPGVPGSFIPFMYSCDVDTLFAIPALGDVDADSDVDLSDFAQLQRCYSGDDVVSGRCELADFDRDRFVSDEDHATLVYYLTDPN